MATHSSVLAWRIPGTAEPGGLPSMGSHRVGHDWSNLAAAAARSLYKNIKSTLKCWRFATGGLVICVYITHIYNATSLPTELQLWEVLYFQQMLSIYLRFHFMRAHFYGYVGPKMGLNYFLKFTLKISFQMIQSLNLSLQQKSHKWTPSPARKLFFQTPA